MSADDSPMFCDRCLSQLKQGSGDYFVVKIEAMADPTPPAFSDEEIDTKEELQRLIAAMEDISEREAMDQVHRVVSFYMCGPCYREWIENPTG